MEVLRHHTPTAPMPSPAASRKLKPMRNTTIDPMDTHMGNFTSLAALSTLARQKEAGQIRMAHPLWISTRMPPSRRIKQAAILDIRDARAEQE